MCGVVAWERDPWLLRLALGQNDWSAALASGRLRLLLGSDLVEHAAAMRARGARGADRVSSVSGDDLPARARVAGSGARWTARWSLLCAGGLFVDDLAAALARAGFAPYTLDIHRLSREELDRTMRRLRPRLIAAINYTEGLAEFAAAHGCKLICWEIDPDDQRAAALPGAGRRRARSCSPIAAPRSPSCAPAASPTSSTCRWPPISSGARRCR